MPVLRSSSTSRPPFAYWPECPSSDGRPPPARVAGSRLYSHSCGRRFQKSYGRYLMSNFDYTASAGLFAAKGRSGLRYRCFPQAAEAIRYAIERLPGKVFLGTSLEVNGAAALNSG